MVCQGGVVLGKYGSFGLAPKYDPWFVWFGSRLYRDQIYNCEMFNFECGAFPWHATAKYKQTKYKQLTVQEFHPTYKSEIQPISQRYTPSLLHLGSLLGGFAPGGKGTTTLAHLGSFWGEVLPPEGEG